MGGLETKLVGAEEILCYIPGDGRTQEVIVQTYDNSSRKVICPLFDSDKHRLNYGRRGCIGTGNVCKHMDYRHSN
jgi:hypothetical protein